MAMFDWINSDMNCGIPKFKKYANTMLNPVTDILNSVIYITNGFTEDCNNKTKVCIWLQKFQLFS